jgi:hypothetical protein
MWKLKVILFCGITFRGSRFKQNRQTGLPKFHIMFRDTDQTYTNLDLDYVLRYSIEVPVKYHLLKAEYIVRKARKAGALAKP